MVSFIGVVLLALILPGLLRLTNSAIKYLVGAEGRLAAIAIDTDRPLGPLPAVWQGLAQGGDNPGGFLDGITATVAEVKPRYIRIDHIYDQFQVVGRESGALTFNWSQLDKTIAKIRETGALPFFSLSYMPPVISVNGDILSPPKNWGDWALVVQKTIEHYSGELGLDNVYYEVWNEPDLFGKWKMGGAKDYRTLYTYAVKGAGQARRVKSFKIGGPGTTGLYRNWVDNFFPYILKNKLRLDFFSWHRYDLNLSKYTDDVKNIDKWIEAHPYFSQVEKIISEMGPTSQMGQENDTQIGAAHLIATARELMYRVRWAMNFAISGNWGMIGKPRFEALLLLSRLGQTRMSVSGEGSWVRAIAAKDENMYQVLITNYDPTGEHNETVPVSFLNLKQKSFILRREFLKGERSETKIATSGAILQTTIPMPANSVVLIELEPIINPL